MPGIVQLRPNDRLAIVGRTGAGKTRLAMVLAGTYVRALPSQWEVWWIDTKGDEEDLKELRRWGFRNAMSPEDQKSSVYGRRAKYFYVRPAGEVAHRYDGEVVDQAQAIFDLAYERRNVVIVVDEYVSVVRSQRSAGRSLLDVFQRGRGLNVGLIGCTQEPVYVPRQLLSQATSIFMMSVAYDLDRQYLQKLDKAYVDPSQKGDRYGFWLRWTDGGTLSYYPHQMAFYEQVRIALPRKDDEYRRASQTVSQ